MQNVMLDANKLSALSKYISDSKKILLICHMNPDGDAIGSMIAMYRYLKSKGKEVAMISPNYLQEFLKWMDSSDSINVYIKNYRKGGKIISESDLIIMLDFSQSSRLGEMERLTLNSKAKKIVIDHHNDPGSFSDLLISDPNRCATAELVYDIIKELEGCPFDDPVFRESIYVGIMTDTGCLDFGSYNGHTLRIVGDLLDAGVDKERVRLNVYNNFSADRMRLMGFALNERMVVLDEYYTAYIYLSNADLERFNHVKGDTEGFVNLPLAIKNIRMSVLIIEKKDLIKFSFRSKGDYSVNEFASKYFGGGGHKNAAGGEYKGSLEDAIKEFLEKLANDNPCAEKQE